MVLIYLPEIGGSVKTARPALPRYLTLQPVGWVEREADSPALPPVPAGQGVLRASSLEFRVPPLQLFPVRDRAAHLVFPSVSSGARTRPPGTGGEPKRSGRAAFRAPLPRLVLLDVVPDELQQYSGHGLALGCRDRLEVGVEFRLHVQVHLLESFLQGHRSPPSRR